MHHNLATYFFGYSPEVKSFIGVRADAQSQVGNDLREEFGDAVNGLTFHVFASIEFLEQRGNSFGRAFNIFKDGAVVQIRQEDKDTEHLYALLTIAGARCISEFLQHTRWSRTLVWRLSQHPDVANMMEGAGLLKEKTILVA